MITKSTAADLPLIYQLFEEAISYQRKNHYIGWDTYDKGFIQNDIANGHSFKVAENGKITGIFSICLSDALIWREREKKDAIYLHRIVVNRSNKDGAFFATVLQWAKEYAVNHGLHYIRMDTWALNKKIIDYYKSYGFTFVEEYITPDTPELPEQHRNLHIALLEMAIETRLNHLNEL